MNRRNTPLKVRSAARGDVVDDTGVTLDEGEKRNKDEKDLKVPTEDIHVGGDMKPDRPASNSNVTRDVEEECNLDDVACCLCKCAVDYGDEFFFLPEETAALDVDVGKRHDEAVEEWDESNASGKPHGQSDLMGTAMQVENQAERESMVECNTSAVVSLDCLVADGTTATMGEPQGSPKTVIHPKEENGVGEVQSTLNGHAVMTTASTGLENTESSPAKASSPVDEGEDDRKPSPTTSKGADESVDGSESSKPPFQLPRRFYNPGNSLILCDGPEYANRKKNGGQYKCNRAYHQLCHFIPGEDCHFCLDLVCRACLFFVLTNFN
jgi:hypothetical protein